MSVNERAICRSYRIPAPFVNAAAPFVHIYVGAPSPHPPPPSIPHFVLMTSLKKALGVAQRMQVKYERYGKIVGAEARAAFPIPPPLAELADEQKRIVSSCLFLEGKEGGEWQPLISASDVVQAHAR